MRAPERRCVACLPQWGRQRGGGFAAPKGSQPRLAVLGNPFQGKGLAWTFPPSYGRRCPEGAEVGWGKRYEKEREDRLKCVVYKSTRAPLRDPPFPMGKSKRRGLRRPKRKPTPPRCARQCTCQQKLDTKLKKLGIKIEYLYKIQ